MSGNRGNMVLAFLAGGAIGAGLALLFAPATGAETRKRLKEGAHDATDWARKFLRCITKGCYFLGFLFFFFNILEKRFVEI